MSNDNLGQKKKETAAFKSLAKYPLFTHFSILLFTWAPINSKGSTFQVQLFLPAFPNTWHFMEISFYLAYCSKSVSQTECWYLWQDPWGVIMMATVHFQTPYVLHSSGRKFRGSASVTLWIMRLCVLGFTPPCYIPLLSFKFAFVHSHISKQTSSLDVRLPLATEHLPTLFDLCCQWCNTELKVVAACMWWLYSFPLCCQCNR